MGAFSLHVRSCNSNVISIMIITMMSTVAAAIFFRLVVSAAARYESPSMENNLIPLGVNDSVFATFSALIHAQQTG